LESSLISEKLYRKKLLQRLVSAKENLTTHSKHVF